MRACSLALVWICGCPSDPGTEPDSDAGRAQDSGPRDTDAGQDTGAEDASSDARAEDTGVVDASMDRFGPYRGPWHCS